jgi:uncharacterized protein
MLEWLDIDLSSLELILFFLAGLGTGIINTLIGSGSLITLPIFVFMCGLPADIANGTNRIGVFFQSLVGYYSFKQQAPPDPPGTIWLIVPCIVGAVFGAWLATDLDTETMNTFIGVLMVAMLGVLLINPKRWLRETQASVQNSRKPLVLLLFFAIGIYAGFIQAGSGIFLIIALVLGAKYSLSQTTGIKLLIISLLSIPALIIFTISGDIHLGFGLMMAIAQSLGAMLGVRFVIKVPDADKWIHRLLILIIIASASKFLGIYDYIVGI